MINVGSPDQLFTLNYTRSRRLPVNEQLQPICVNLCIMHLPFSLVASDPA